MKTSANRETGKYGSVSHFSTVLSLCTLTLWPFDGKMLGKGQACGRAWKKGKYEKCKRVSFLETPLQTVWSVLRFCLWRLLLAAIQNRRDQIQFGFQHDFQAGQFVDRILDRFVDLQDVLAVTVVHLQHLLDFFALRVENMGNGGLLQSYGLKKGRGGAAFVNIGTFDFWHTHNDKLLFSLPYAKMRDSVYLRGKVW